MSYSNKNLVISIGSFAVSLNVNDAYDVFNILQNAVQLDTEYSALRNEYVYVERAKQQTVKLESPAYMLPGNCPCPECCEDIDESEVPF